METDNKNPVPHVPRISWKIDWVNRRAQSDTPCGIIVVWEDFNNEVFIEFPWSARRYRARDLLPSGDTHDMSGTWELLVLAMTLAAGEYQNFSKKKTQRLVWEVSTGADAREMWYTALTPFGTCFFGFSPEKPTEDSFDPWNLDQTGTLIDVATPWGNGSHAIYWDIGARKNRLVDESQPEVSEQLFKVKPANTAPRPDRVLTLGSIMRRLDTIYTLQLKVELDPFGENSSSNELLAATLFDESI